MNVINYHTKVVETTEYSNIQTVGELKSILNKYPNEMQFGFRNQPEQNLLHIKHKFADIEHICFQEINKIDSITNTLKWVAVMDELPEPLQTVWLTNGKGWCCLGCLVESEGGWHWAKSNGVIYIENGQIVSECESDDLDVNYWQELPKPFFL